jgi:hypothetical protein
VSEWVSGAAAGEQLATLATVMCQCPDDGNSAITRPKSCE